MEPQQKTPWGNNARNSLSALALIPFTFVASFAIGTMLIGDPNVPGGPEGWDAAWRVVIIWLIFASPPAIGLWFARRAAKGGEHGSKAALIVNGVVFAFMTLISLGSGLMEAFR